MDPKVSGAAAGKSQVFNEPGSQEALTAPCYYN